MPRAKRHLVNGGVYHVMIRGVNKQFIFNNDKDKQMFIRILKHTVKKYNFIIYAYCLMNNHVHILLEDNRNLISKFMHDLDFIYAKEFNQKYKRVGHLFQDRYKSIYVYDEYYLLRLIRYIHRNPEKAGICKTEDYIWSSYKEYSYTPRIIKKERILNLFNKSEKIAIKKFKEFVADDSQERLDRIYAAEKLEDNEAIELIKDATKINDLKLIKKFPKEKKKKVIKDILKINNISASQISRILDIEKNFKAKLN